MKHLYLTLATLAIAIIYSISANAQVQYNNCTVGREYASAIGDGNNAEGKYSFAGGTSSSSIGECSFTFGYSSSSVGKFSTVIGGRSTANAWYSMCIGNDIINNTQGSIIIGNGKSNTNPLTLDGYKDNAYLAFGVRSTVPTMVLTPGDINRTGNVYIGNVKESDAKLHIHSDSYADCSVMLTTASDDSPTVIYFRNTDNKINVDQNNAMTLSAASYCFTTGKVGIGCTNTTEDFALAVQGGILTDDVLVRNNNQWPDFVFGNDYNLMPLAELKKYIGENKHLPNVPSEAEVADKGVSVGEMQTALLQKVEELTLYTIQQQEMIEQLRLQCERQQQMIDQLMGK